MIFDPEKTVFCIIFTSLYRFNAYVDATVNWALGQCFSGFPPYLYVHTDFSIFLWYCVFLRYSACCYIVFGVILIIYSEHNKQNFVFWNWGGWMMGLSWGFLIQQSLQKPKYMPKTSSHQCMSLLFVWRFVLSAATWWCVNAGMLFPPRDRHSSNWWRSWTELCCPFLMRWASRDFLAFDDIWIQFSWLCMYFSVCLYVCKTSHRRLFHSVLGPVDAFWTVLPLMWGHVQLLYFWRRLRFYPRCLVHWPLPPRLPGRALSDRHEGSSPIGTKTRKATHSLDLRQNWSSAAKSITLSLHDGASQSP